VTRERRFYLWAFPAAYVAWILAFEAVGWYAATLPTHDLSTPIDRAIPLVPGAVWVYELCYLFPFLPLALARDWNRVNRAFLAVVLANAAAVAVYLFLPVAFEKPALGASLSERVLAVEYRLDFRPGANHLPSLHVAFAWIVAFACLRQGLSRLWEALVLAGAAAITASTLLVKQHVVVDALGGIATAALAWLAAGRLLPRVAPGPDAPEGFRRIALRVGAPSVAAAALLALLRAATR
jgi:membrane-associated phospholipid phosphatase